MISDTSDGNDQMRYDAAGQLLWDSWTNPSNAARDFGYNNNGKIGRVKDGSGNLLARYEYDADGQRVRRVINSVETWQVYGMGGELLAEYAPSASQSAPQKEYGYRGGEMLVVTETQPSFTIRWLVSDHLGTARIIADLTGSLTNIKRHDYLPFGEDVPAAYRSSGYGYVDEGVRQQFTGYERDDETGLDYADARFFSSLQGRFTSPDPLMSSGSLTEPQGWNGYAYVGNRPTVIIDPDGLRWYYNTQLRKFGWCDCPGGLNQADRDNGWVEVRGAGVYEAVNGHLIFLDPNNKKYRDLTAEAIARVEESRLKMAKDQAERYVNGILLDFITTSVGYGFSLGTGGLSGLATDIVVDSAFGYLSSVLDESDVSEDSLSSASAYWDPSYFNGNKVYLRDDLIDPDLTGADGKTNLDRMKAGNAPVGPDGKKINLHHMLQTQDGPIAEVTQTFHKTNHRIIHINNNKTKSGINRALFNAWKKTYWVWRASHFKN